MWVPIITLAIVSFVVYICLTHSSRERKMVENDDGITSWSVTAICTEGIEHFQNDQKVKLRLLSDKLNISQDKSSISLSFHKISDIHFDKRKELESGIIAASVSEVIDIYIKYNDETDIEKQLVFKNIKDGTIFIELFIKRVFPEQQNTPPHPPYVEL